MTRSTWTMFTAALAASALAVSHANAAYITTNPDPILGGSLVSSAPVQQAPYGYITFNLTNVKETGISFSAGDEVIDYTASPVLNFYSDSSLTTLTNTATLAGQFQIKVTGRSTAFQTGTFSFNFVTSTATGTLGSGGQSVSVSLDPTKTSGGTTSITAGPGIGQFTIDTTATQYSQFTIGSGDPTPIAPLSLVGVPEPTSLAVLAAGLIGIGIRRRRSA